MGEIADAMVEGDMCPCGEWIGDGSGFPQYCSKRCADDFGGADIGLPTVGAKVPRTRVDGFWLQMMEAITDGADTQTLIAEKLRKPGESVRRARSRVDRPLRQMRVAGLIKAAHGKYTITGRGRVQMGGA